MTMTQTASVSAEDIEKYLHRHIPITRTMKVKVRQADDMVVRLSAAHAPNINHRGTVFGGSACALAILSAWAMLYRKLMLQHFDGRIVIQQNRMCYDKPITGNFTADCKAPAKEEWTRFKATLKRWGKARINLKSTVQCGGETTGQFDGDYVAMDKEDKAEEEHSMDGMEF